MYKHYLEAVFNAERKYLHILNLLHISFVCMLCFRISISRVEYLTEEDQQQQDMLDIRCLRVLRALIHNRIKMIDPEEEDREPVHYRE